RDAAPGGRRSHGPLADAVRLWILSGILLLSVAVVVSQSRGAFVALLGGALVTLLVHLTQRRVRLAQAGVIALFGLALIFLLGFLQFDWANWRVWTHLARVNPLAEGRLVKWREAIAAAREFPVFGTGLGTFG